MDPEKSEALLSKVYEVSEQPNGHIYEHVWKPGDMVLWVSEEL